ncbi:MAG: CCA tRNA nucleotidyltransferase [Rhodospirillales bacterium]|nr:CCA tRNA nucleotidyltransferase [Rhodospirillales bacterium]
MTPRWMNEAPVRTLLGALAQGGIVARFVGGCVRDWVLGRPIADIDIDIAVDKPPEAVMKALEAAGIKVVPTGLKHGTVTAIVKSRPFEITTLRRDVETDGRRAVVAFTDDWRTDAERRDFTFNALYAEPDGTIHDYFDGRTDLLAGRVRFIGDPEQRIAEDRLRVLRFFRFHARYGRPPFDGPSFDACRRNAATVSGLSGERVRKELFRTLDATGAADAFDAMLEAGVLDHWLPEYAGSAKLRALAAREETPDPLRRLAAVLPTEADATAIGKRLKLSTQESVRLQLMLDPANAVETANLRASLYRLGTKLFIDRVLLDAPGDWRAALALAGAWTPPELPIGGNDALALGLKPGPKVGALIEAVERWWIAGDFSAGRDACLAELKRLVDAETS